MFRNINRHNFWSVLFAAEESFELSIACAQGFFDMFGLNQHGRQGKTEKMVLTDNSNFRRIVQD